MLSLIQVDGDSMSPTLNHGDDIMVDNRAATGPLRDGIHVIRLDDALMVKRLASGPGGRLSVLSDNPAYPGWPDVDGTTVAIIGRVVWAGRRL
jgi:phage repressor protein C with HTH and peptisase S24 domain